MCVTCKTLCESLTIIRNCDFLQDRRTDRQIPDSDPYVPLCFPSTFVTQNKACNFDNDPWPFDNKSLTRLSFFILNPHMKYGVCKMKLLGISQTNWPFAKFRTCGSPCGFLTSFHCDVTIAQLFDGPFDCDVIMKKSANRCTVGPLAIRQLWQMAREADRP